MKSTYSRFNGIGESSCVSYSAYYDSNRNNQNAVANQVGNDLIETLSPTQDENLVKGLTNQIMLTRFDKSGS